MRRYALAVVAAVLLILLAGCGSSESAAPTSGGGGGIEISGFAYTGSLTVKPSQKVAVTNDDPTQHTLTSQTSGLFSTGTIEASGGTETFTAPATPGRYPFVCRLHPTMTGTLTVG
jgi:plastocyanin